MAGSNPLAVAQPPRSRSPWPTLERRPFRHAPIQYSGLLGLYERPYCLFAVDDLIVNTAGTGLGWALTGPLARILSHPDALTDRVLDQLTAGKAPFACRLVALLPDTVRT